MKQFRYITKKQMGHSLNRIEGVLYLISYQLKFLNSLDSTISKGKIQEAKDHSDNADEVAYKLSLIAEEFLKNSKISNLEGDAKTEWDALYSKLIEAKEAIKVISTAAEALQTDKRPTIARRKNTFYNSHNTPDDDCHRNTKGEIYKIRGQNRNPSNNKKNSKRMSPFDKDSLTTRDIFFIKAEKRSKQRYGI
ncbi:MAG: hypothetical protein FWD15_04610 [Alphaproteobacteria bacterium]|nr:hypothetical protein [Alphaproteobacteria bacterium]